MGPVVDVVYQATISTGLRNPSCLMEDSGASSELGHNLALVPLAIPQKGTSESAACLRGRLHSSLERGLPTPTPTPTPVATPTPTPTPTPALDTIKIQRAEYQRSKGSLRVDVTGTEPAATLRVYVTATGALVGTLKNNGHGRFSASLLWPTYPENITVRSNFGASAASFVTLK